MAKKSAQKSKYLENKRDFNMKEKAFLILFKGLSLKEIFIFYFTFIFFVRLQHLFIQATFYK